MSTWYTNKIKDDITFEKFVMNCSRAFGALVTMRDNANDSVIPEKFEPSTYHIDKLKELKKRLLKIEKMSPDAANQEAIKEYESAFDCYEKSIKDKRELKKKYEKMLVYVNEWVPPTNEHIGLKNFMIEQITESIDWDCDESCEKPPEPVTGRFWKWDKIEKIKNDIEYHEKENNNEIELVNARNKWLSDLRKSLK